MSESTNCRYCGIPVLWQVSKAGRKYLAQSVQITNEDGRHIKTIYPAHQCKATPEERANVDAQLRAANESALANGVIMKGQTVVVYKGRKVPIGTTGIVTWVAHEQDGYGVTKIRIALENGEAHYLNIENVRAANETKAAS